MKRMLSLLLAVLFLFAGCASKEKTVEPGSAMGGSSAIDPFDKFDSHSGGDSAGEPAPIAQLKTLGLGSGNSKGFYRVSQDLNEGDMTYALLLYVDYATKQEVPLCAKPSCAHKSDDCTAYLPGGSFEYKILAEEDRLFLFYLPMGGGAMGEFRDGTAATPCLYAMKADGTGRTKLLDLPTGAQVFEPIVYGGGKIYAGAETTRMENPGSGLAQSVTENRRLVVFNTIEKTMENVCPLHYFDLLVGAYDGRLLLKRFDFTEDPNALGESAYNTLFAKTPVRLVSRDPATGEEIELIAGKGGDLDDLRVAGENVFIGGPASTIRRLTLSDNQVSVLTDKLPAGKHCLEAADDRVLVTYINNKEVNADVTDVLQVDNATGAVTPMALFTENPRGVVPILARIGNQYLVVYDYRYEEKKTWAGTNQVEIKGWKCALIDVADYWNNKKAYTPIKNSGESEGG